MNEEKIIEALNFFNLLGYYRDGKVSFKRDMLIRRYEMAIEQNLPHADTHYKILDAILYKKEVINELNKRYFNGVYKTGSIKISEDCLNFFKKDENTTKIIINTIQKLNEIRTLSERIIDESSTRKEVDTKKNAIEEALNKLLNNRYEEIIKNTLQNEKLKKNLDDSYLFKFTNLSDFLEELNKYINNIKRKKELMDNFMIDLGNKFKSDSKTYGVISRKYSYMYTEKNYREFMKKYLETRELFKNTPAEETNTEENEKESGLHHHQ